MAVFFLQTVRVTPDYGGNYEGISVWNSGPGM